MAHAEKQWHPRFIEYMEFIINHPNYKGLPIIQKNDGSYSWIATAKSEIGKGRISWCLNKAHELELIYDYKPYPGIYADVMLKIHPTKTKVCQICGREMSLYYVYPNANFLKELNAKFNSNFTDCDSIDEIWNQLIDIGVDETELTNYLIKKGKLDLDSSSVGKKEVILALEYACRKGNRKCLGPGAMSNFPDRFDGFHTYNRCCRATQDTGRSKENLKSYTKDRRAYEYWSDGNIHAANQFMGSTYFEGISADHIGPISLGFVHDPRYLQPMRGGDNSAKRDRLQIVDIENIISTEKRTGVYPMSWYSKTIWEFIKKNYKFHPNKVESVYRDALKQNMSNFMYVLYTITKFCPLNGNTFLIEAFLKPHFDCFKYTYSFNEYGDIKEIRPRHYTDRNKNEAERYTRIALDAIDDYNDKSNRNIKNDLTPSETQELRIICQSIESKLDIDSNKKSIERFIEKIEKRIITAL